jgi:hypothetical protein
MTIFSPLDEIPREKEEIMLAHLTTSEGPNRQSLILKAHKEKVEQIFQPKPRTADEPTAAQSIPFPSAGAALVSSFSCHAAAAAAVELATNGSMRRGLRRGLDVLLLPLPNLPTRPLIPPAALLLLPRCLNGFSSRPLCSFPGGGRAVEQFSDDEYDHEYEDLRVCATTINTALAHMYHCVACSEILPFIASSVPHEDFRLSPHSRRRQWRTSTSGGGS